LSLLFSRAAFSLFSMQLLPLLRRSRSNTTCITNQIIQNNTSVAFSSGFAAAYDGEAEHAAGAPLEVLVGPGPWLRWLTVLRIFTATSHTVQISFHNVDRLIRSHKRATAKQPGRWLKRRYKCSSLRLNTEAAKLPATAPLQFSWLLVKTRKHTAIAKSVHLQAMALTAAFTVSVCDKSSEY
jgi:hypothetical protein